MQAKQHKTACLIYDDKLRPPSLPPPPPDGAAENNDQSNVCPGSNEVRPLRRSSKNSDVSDLVCKAAVV